MKYEKPLLIMLSNLDQTTGGCVNGPTPSGTCKYGNYAHTGGAAKCEYGLDALGNCSNGTTPNQ